MQGCATMGGFNGQISSERACAGFKVIRSRILNRNIWMRTSAQPSAFPIFEAREQVNDIFWLITSVWYGLLSTFFFVFTEN